VSATNVRVAAQALVAAITGEANRRLSLDLSILGYGSQLPGRTAITNFGQGSTIHTKKTKITSHMQDSTVNSDVLHVACVGGYNRTIAYLLTYFGGDTRI
jgi:hypothetical protein